MIILINRNAHVVWTAGETVAEAQAAADAMAGYTQEWTEVSIIAADGDRYIAVQVEGDDWSADDADRAISEGTVLGYWRADDILETAA